MFSAIISLQATVLRFLADAQIRSSRIMRSRQTTFHASKRPALNNQINPEDLAAVVVAFPSNLHHNQALNDKQSIPYPSALSNPSKIHPLSPLFNSSQSIHPPLYIVSMPFPSLHNNSPLLTRYPTYSNDSNDNSTHTSNYTQNRVSFSILTPILSSSA